MGWKSFCPSLRGPQPSSPILSVPSLLRSPVGCWPPPPLIACPSFCNLGTAILVPSRPILGVPL